MLGVELVDDEMCGRSEVCTNGRVGRVGGTGRVCAMGRTGEMGETSETGGREEEEVGRRVDGRRPVVNEIACCGDCGGVAIPSPPKLSLLKPF